MHDSRRTELRDVDGVRRLLLVHANRHPRALGPAAMTALHTQLAVAGTGLENESARRTVPELLGQKAVTTTMISTQGRNRGGRGVRRPLDAAQ